MEPHNHAGAEMMVRRPVAEVFNAFIDPAVTKNFWFTDSTGPLTPGASVTWTWAMYNVSVPVTVIAIVANESIAVKWGNGDHISRVTWAFKALTPTKTYVTVVNDKFQSEGDQLIFQIRDSTQGFTIVLAGVKAWLEQGINLNLIDDKYPAEMRG